MSNHFANLDTRLDWKLDEERFPFPSTQPSRRQRSESPESPQPVEVPKVAFEDSVFDNVINELISIQGEFEGSSEPLSPETARSTHIEQSESPTLKPTQSVIPQPLIQTVIPPPLIQPVIPHNNPTDLAVVYPDHTISLELLQNGEYQGAYGLCFRVRLFQWVMDDLPIGTDITKNDVVGWLSVNSSKTFDNMRSHFNRAQESLEWLRRQDPLDEADSGTEQVLSKLVEGSLTLLPSRQRGRAIRSEVLDAATIEALDMSAAGLHRLNLEIKQRQRAIKK